MNFEEKLEVLKQAIERKKLVAIVADTDSSGRIERKCVPYDYGASSSGKVCFHFKTLDSPTGGHIFLCLEKKLIDIKLLDDDFDPAEYITWTPNWHIERDWGEGLS